MIDLVCERCGKNYRASPSRTRSRFCSRECYAPPVVMACEHCGIEYRRKPRDAKTSRFCSYACKDAHPKSPEVIEKIRIGGLGNKNHFQGGRRILGGYVQIYSPDHPYRTKNKCVYEHRLVMEKQLGRYLLPEEVVHHKNENTQDNRLENLELFSCNAEHLKLHGRHRKPENTHRQCPRCKEVILLNIENFGPNKRNKQGFSYYCRACERERQRTAIVAKLG